MIPALIGLYSPVPGCGKDTIAAHLTAAHGFTNVKCAGTLKAMLAVLYRALGYDNDQIPDLLDGPDRERCEIIPARFGHITATGDFYPAAPAITARDLLQTLGTEWGRRCVHPDLWITCLSRTLLHHRMHGQRVIVTDLRFPNEYDTIRTAGGQIWRINRSEAQARTHKAHASNGALDAHAFDQIIDNDGTIPDLLAKVDAIMRGDTIRSCPTPPPSSAPTSATSATAPAPTTPNT